MIKEENSIYNKANVVTNISITKLQPKLIESQASDKKVELADFETISDYVTDLNGLLKDGTLVEKRAVITSFIKNINVTGNETAWSYSMLMIQEKIVVEADGVLPIVHYGGR